MNTKWSVGETRVEIDCRGVWKLKKVRGKGRLEVGLPHNVKAGNT